MIPYTILKSKPQHYQVKLIDVALQVAAKYQKELLQFCRERPQIPNMTAEETVSELLIDRMPRFLLNVRTLTFEEIKLCARTDTTAATNPEALEYNMQSFQRRIKRLQNEHTGSAEDKKEIDILLEQIGQLQRLQQVGRIEKKLLTYLRSCVRRTKLKYLQTAYRENKVVTNVDPTNGMLEVECHRTNYDDRTRLTELFDLLQIDEGDRTLVQKVLLEGVLFKELGAEMYSSRQTAARRYQDAMGRIKRRLQGYLRSNPDSRVVSNTMKKELLK